MRKWSQHVSWNHHMHMNSHAVHHNVDFSTLQILSRKQLVQLLTKYYQMDFLKPRLHSIPISDGTVATMTVIDVKALWLHFWTIRTRCAKKTLHLTMIYLPKKLKTHSQELMKFTQDHCGNLQDKNIVGMTQMHSPWHWCWCVFTIRQIPMSLVLCRAPHSFVLQHFWTVTVATMTQITWYKGMSLILGVERVQQMYHTHQKWNYRTNTIVYH